MYVTESDDQIPQHSPESGPGGEKRPSGWRRRATKVAGGVLAGVLLVLAVVAEYVLHHLEPIVRTRLIQTLSESFNSPVELDELHISLVRGIEVEGDRLRIPYGYNPNGDPKAHVGPLLSVQRFTFRTTLKGLLHHTTHVDEVRADGVEIHIPPHSQRGVLLGTREGRLPADPVHPKIRPRIAFTVSHVVDTNVKLFLETDKPGKEALEFDIRRLELHKLNPDEAAIYTADLVNAKPKGDISATGHFGPWVSDDPRETPMDGDFTFTNADLNTIKGIGGTLQGAGHFAGRLDNLAVDGTADVPNFSLDTANHPVPLYAKYHASVDGTTGDTTLAPVEARLGHSDFTTQGKIVKLPGGHDIQLDVNIPHAQVSDFLRLAVKTSPPLMNGALAMKAKLHVPPGQERVPMKMSLQGKFHIGGVHFSNLKFQNRVDGLSVRAQGHPEEVKSVSSDAKAQASSEMSADISLQHGMVSANDVKYTVPGAVVLMNGVYSMDGNIFEFKGHVRTEATASQMVGGWKGLLLKPLDHLLKKDGAGLELPIEVSGTSGDVNFGLAMQGADESTQSMARDLKGRRPAVTDPTKLKPARKTRRAEDKAEKKAER